MNTQNLFADTSQLLEGLIIDDAVNQQESITCVHEGLAEGRILILTGSIQDLDLKSLAINIDGRLV